MRDLYKNKDGQLKFIKMIEYIKSGPFVLIYIFLKRSEKGINFIMDKLTELKINEMNLIKELSGGNIEKAREYYEKYSKLFEEITNKKTTNSFEELEKIAKEKKFTENNYYENEL